MVSAHSDNIYMDARLFERVKAVYEGREAMNYTKEQTRLLEKVYNAFVRNGISLPEAEQARMREINAELSTLQQKFGNNLLAETNAFQLVLESEEDLVGLPEAVRTAAAEAAKAAGMEGKWLIGLQNPSRIPFLQYSERRDLREKVYKAYIERGNNGNENDPQPTVDVALLTQYAAECYQDQTFDAEYVAVYDVTAGTMLFEKNDVELGLVRENLYEARISNHI